MKEITVLLCDDHVVVREGLRALLEATDDIQVVGETEDGRHAVSETKRLHPSVVLMDIAMSLLNGVEAARQIIQEAPATRVLILSCYGDVQHVRQAVEAGVAGYLVKSSASNDLLRAIREVWLGNSFFSPPISLHLLREWRSHDLNSITPGVSTLTSRQAEVLQLIAEGYSSAQIAVQLLLSQKTIEKHRQSLMDILDIHNIALLTRYAILNGVVESYPAPNAARPIKGARRARGSCARPALALENSELSDADEHHSNTLQPLAAA